MNVWNSNEKQVGQPFRVTAGGARYMKIKIDGGSGTYTLEESHDGTTFATTTLTGTTTIVHDVGADGILLSGMCKVTGTAGATIYVMQED